MNFLLNFLLTLKYKNKKRQLPAVGDATVGYSISGIDEAEKLKLHVSLKGQDLGLYLDNDFIVIDKAKALILSKMLEKGLKEMEDFKATNPHLFK